jgi:hypothetical protein
VSGVGVKFGDGFGIVYVAGLHCCLVLHLDIFGRGLFELFFFRPNGEESVAVDSAMIIVEGPLAVARIARA